MARQPVHTHLRHLPCGGGAGYLYAARFASGVIKIGATRMPLCRAINLQQSWGELIEEVQAVRLAKLVDIYTREKLALRRADALASRVPGRREFFTGLSFADAVRAISEEIQAEFQPAAAQKA